MAKNQPEPTADAHTRSQADSARRSPDDTQPAFTVRQQPAVSSDGPGTLIGNYILESQLGEGGFGTVWLAEQIQPIRRHVAFKVLKLGMNSREIVARFDQERQALAVMDHPGIAKVLDAGITPEGRSYFVMELVEGLPLNQFCDQHRLPLLDRLKLFTSVCGAVQHAHQKGLIHRDLKSSNILVVNTDDGPQPKVIDFGIAKALIQPLVDVTLQTQVGQVIGTPAFMSPEQAEGRVHDLDTRSDVYSLGVVLYQLVTDSLPFDLDQIKRGGTDELRRQIVEQVPMRPSSKIQAYAEPQQRELAQRFGHDGQRLLGLLRGDIDWIILKALEKEPSRRYQSAAEFAADIRRHLKNEPVIARPPSTSYVVRRFVARHRGAVTAVTLLLTTLVTALVVSLNLFFSEKRARAAAETSAIRSQQVARVWKEMMAAAGPSKAKGRDASMLKEILSKTAERLGQDLQDQPDVEAELRSVIGVTFEDLGEFELSLQQQQRVIELRRQVWGSTDPRLVTSLYDLSSALDYADQLSLAQTAVEEAIEIDQQQTPVNKISVAKSQNLLAWILYRQGDLAGAEREARASLAVYQAAPEDQEEMLASALDTLGTLLLKTARVDESADCHRQALEFTRKHSGDLDPDMVISSNNLCHTLIKQGAYEEADRLARASIELEEKITGEKLNSCTDALLKVRAQCRAAEGAWEEAVQFAQQAIEAAETIYGPNHRFTNDKRALLARTQIQAGQLDAAAETLQAARAAGWGESAEHSLEVSQALWWLAKGAGHEAELAAQRAVEYYRQQMKVPTIEIVDALHVLAQAYVAQGKPESAREALNEGLQILRPNLNPKMPMVLELQTLLSRLPTVGSR